MAVVALRGVCRINQTSMHLVGLLLKAMYLMLRVGEMFANHLVIVCLACQVLGSPFLAIPNLVKRTTALRDWS